MNKTFIYQGIAGLHCECGNAESLVATGRDDYDGFYYTWSTRTGSGKGVGYCRKCGSTLHDVHVRPTPPGKHAELLAEFGAPVAIDLGGGLGN